MEIRLSSFTGRRKLQHLLLLSRRRKTMVLVGQPINPYAKRHVLRRRFTADGWLNQIDILEHR